MSIDAIKEGLPDYAKDIKINVSRVLTEENSKGLTLQQIYGVALAVVYTLKNDSLLQNIMALTKVHLDEAELTGIKSAVSIMAMNNVYYRSMGCLSDPTYSQLQAGLRMMVIANPGIEKANFELYCLAVSAINGCHFCIDSHAKTLQEAGVSYEGVQSVIRIAAVLSAVAQVNKIESL
jgi:alkyl hydroperoxide reductase subunit D